MRQVRGGAEARRLGYDRYRQDRGPRPGTIRAKLTRRTPLEVLARLGVLLMIALAFGLAAELLVRLPPH